MYAFRLFIYICMQSSSLIFIQYNLKIIIIKAKRKSDTSRKGCNNPTSDELSNSYLFCGKGPQFHNSTSKLDISLILGMNKGSSYASILLCRFHKLHANLSTKAKSNLMLCLWKKKIEIKDVWVQENRRIFRCAEFNPTKPDSRINAFSRGLSKKWIWVYLD